ncbi:MAG: CRISPR-associated endonuclease Cas2 [Candidatus Tagabacteria bacterium CG_4_10_14_0_2_um_filter_40_13]|uniref:CRISPR-associated endonuclease Cas2 n=2 Tax=Candidatus Tagaibacteriota TaxID=1817918 RepID=A0A2M7B920_9BACT|nr:MAG: CRISPR-associated endonuclease Cas2 [Candidatus Tagabacteria bacterium CG11_big_fil_rev_8_21_14_0_20_41_11]PIU99581.1 MAG: CRISPR-associated endonuclease Cas2 [Candidatus Tagabacteria bacterium CG03_land_8_20_14_0_80_41_22]PIZ56520.1 MAG: CRISPR-associated endonuclease Cas2 [Candidatus Tagabacteria bacterium CG_4_10_14_0_2_um_filter_40_13]PJC25300.1 MAG: CRISPR-associated endonuclease Cas2 [Candidatus Tagabacteria bacterium CG_4_9_14_0_2_um_filter_41_11]
MKKIITEKRVKIAKIVLKTIGVAGFISMAILAPNALQALGMFYDRKKYNPKYQVNKAVARLKEKGLVEFRNENGKIFLRLTKKGKTELLKYQLQELTIKKPSKWDGKWRIVIFDIKEYKRRIRDKLRQTLETLGFLKLQNSVWVHPYECEEVITILKSHFHIGKDVLYITAERIENDKWMCQKFSLVNNS